MPEEATGTSLRPQLARKRGCKAISTNLLSEFRGRRGDDCLVIDFEYYDQRKKKIPKTLNVVGKVQRCLDTNTQDEL